MIVTQFPNISAAFGAAAAGMKEGEALVFKPAVEGSAEPVGRVTIDQWPTLAEQLKHNERYHGA